MNKNWSRAAVCVALVVTSLAANADSIAESGIAREHVIATMPVKVVNGSAKGKGYLILTDQPCKNPQILDTGLPPLYVAVTKGSGNAKGTVEGCYSFQPPGFRGQPNNSIMIYWESGEYEDVAGESAFNWSPFGKALANADRVRASLIKESIDSIAAATAARTDSKAK